MTLGLKSNIVKLLSLPPQVDLSERGDKRFPGQSRLQRQAPAVPPRGRHVKPLPSFVVARGHRLRRGLATTGKGVRQNGKSQTLTHGRPTVSKYKVASTLPSTPSKRLTSSSQNAPTAHAPKPCATADK